MPSEEGEITWDGLRIDIGAPGREHAFELVRPGDPIVLDGPPEALPNGRVLSTALDDRVGIYAGLEILRRLAADPAAWDSPSSSPDRRKPARTAARASPRGGSLRSGDHPRGDLRRRRAGDQRLGRRRSTRRRPDRLPRARRQPCRQPRTSRTAAEAGITVAIEAGQATSSDTDDIFTAGAGVACGMVCIPLRYMHTAGEIVQLSDVDDALRLVEAYIRSLTAVRVVSPLAGGTLRSWPSNTWCCPAASTRRIAGP